MTLAPAPAYYSPITPASVALAYQCETALRAVFEAACKAEDAAERLYAAYASTATRASLDATRAARRSVADAWWQSMNVCDDLTR